MLQKELPNLPYGFKRGKLYEFIHTVGFQPTWRTFSLSDKKLLPDGISVGDFVVILDVEILEERLDIRFKALISSGDIVYIYRVIPPTDQPESWWFKEVSHG